MPKKIYSDDDMCLLTYSFFTEKDNSVPNLMKITGITESALNRRLDLILSKNMSKLSSLAKNNNYKQFKPLYYAVMELRKSN